MSAATNNAKWEHRISIDKGLYSNKTLDSKGNVINKKKRVGDTAKITALLSSKSPLKLTLKQLRFLQMIQVREQVTYKQREWLDALTENLFKIN